MIPALFHIRILGNYYPEGTADTRERTAELAYAAVVYCGVAADCRSVDNDLGVGRGVFRISADREVVDNCIRTDVHAASTVKVAL